MTTGSTTARTSSVRGPARPCVSRSTTGGAELLGSDGRAPRSQTWGPFRLGSPQVDHRRRVGPLGVAASHTPMINPSGRPTSAVTTNLAGEVDAEAWPNW